MSRDLSQATTYKDKVRTSSAVSRWSMDSSDVDSGVIKDSWGNNDGTINGASTGVSGVGAGEAFSFDGSDDNVNLGSIDLSSFSAVTISLWVKFVSLTENQQIIGTYGVNNSADGEAIDVYDWDGNGNIDLAYVRRDSSGNAERILLQIKNLSIGTGTWNHLVATRSGTSASEMELYLNGAKLNTAEDASQGAGTFSKTPCVIGERDNDWNLSGEIDEVRVYSEALSQQQMWKLYNIGRNANWGYSRS